ncbi:nitric oxide-associated protein 1 [Sarotherodon galilaeus]
MSAFHPNNAVDQSARASSPELFVPHPDFYIDDFMQVDYDAIDSTVRSTINPAVFRGNLETILPAEPPLPINERPRREDDVIFVSAHQENCRKIRFNTEAVIENIQTLPQQKEEEDDVIFVTAYQENCRKIRFKSEATVPIQTPATDNRAEERENIAIQTPATDNRAEERENIPTDTENRAEEPSGAPPLRRLRGRRRFHKRRILGDLTFMYAITVRAYASIYRHKDL